jgi:hypothetical protein
MAKLYYNKIKNQEINFMTGEVWTIEDVPSLWRQQVQEMLDGEEYAD